jgi:predicted dehydrogenase
MTSPASSVSTLNVAVVGCGMMATGSHLPNVAQHPHLNLRWCCDIDEDRARAAAKSFGAEHVTTDYMDVLRDPAVDLVILATTHAVRGEFIVASAKAGKPCLVEKPMAGSPKEVAEILKAVRESGIPFCVNHNRRSAPATKDALALLDRLEQMEGVNPWRLDRNTWLRPEMPEERQRMVLIRVNDDVLSWKPWAFEEGAIINEMTHFIDLANVFMGHRQPRQVSVVGSARMNFTILVAYDDGSLATLAHSAVGTLDYPKELFEITYKGAMIAIDHLMEIRVMGIPDEPFRRTYATLDAAATTTKPGIEGFYESAQQTIAERLRGGNMERFIGSPNKGHYAHLEQFVECIRGNAVSPCDAEEGAKSTMLTLKAVEACRLGLPLRFGPEEWQILML